MDTLNVCNQIRRKIKEKDYTQDEFSKIIGVSIATLNRWLRGEGLLFSDLSLMAEKLEIKLSEIVTLAEGDMVSNFTYTLEQENSFANTEGLLAFFDHLLKGKSVSSIARSYKLSEKSLNFYLSKLDKLKLIEWLPHNKVKLKVNGEPRWLTGGPLSHKFRKQIIDEHIQNHLNNREMLKIGLYSLSQESCKKIEIKQSEFIEFVRTLEIKDTSNNQNSKLTTLILGYGKSDVGLLTKIPNH